MAPEEPGLVELDETIEREYLCYLAEIRAAGEEPVPWVLTRPADDFPALVRWYRDQAKGIGLREGWVSHSTFWLAATDGRLLGVSNLRHRLTESLLRFGGHIGYGIRPSQRRKGYATRLLALTLEKAHGIGLTRVLLTCDKDNVASARVIERNGGQLENEAVIPETGKIKLHYWIDLA